MRSGAAAENWPSDPEQARYADGPLRQPSGGGLFSVRMLVALAVLAVAVKVGVAMVPDFIRYMKIRSM